MLQNKPVKNDMRTEAPKPPPPPPPPPPKKNDMRTEVPKSRRYDTGKIKFCAKKFPNFLPGTLAFYRIVNISNDQQMSLINTLPYLSFKFSKMSSENRKMLVENALWRVVSCCK